MIHVEESQILGRRLRGVRYDLFEWDAEPIAGSAIDSVPKAVILIFDRITVILRWDLNPPSEQLVMLTDEGAPSDPLVRRVDVSDRWRALLGAELAEASWSQQETGEGVQPWAVTLRFNGVGGLVVALGEVVAGALSYIPDSLVVTASRDLALSYRPPSALAPAWTTRSELEGA